MENTYLNSGRSADDNTVKPNNIKTTEELVFINQYTKVIENFKKIPGVMNGADIGWKGGGIDVKFENRPKSIGDGLTTTGWCVSASEALLNSPIFQTLLEVRNAKAKLISIDIKEQYYGFCYNGSQNKWHTAILVNDSKMNFVIDITCTQFGNNFVGKDIWSFETWQDTLRSPMCAHKLYDFDGCELSLVNNDSILPKYLSNSSREYLINDIKSKLYDVTNLMDHERNFISDFIINDMDVINDQVTLESLTPENMLKVDRFNGLISKLPITTLSNGYSVLTFSSMKAMVNWITKLVNNQLSLPRYMFISDSVKSACNLISFDHTNFDLPLDKSNIFILLFKFNRVTLTDSSFLNNTVGLLPIDYPLNISPNNMYNTGERIVGRDNNPKETNTIVIEVNNM